MQVTSDESIQNPLVKCQKSFKNMYTEQGLILIYRRDIDIHKSKL